MLFTNPTPHTVKLDALGFDSVGPGEDVELPLALCAPHRKDNGQRGNSPVENIAPQLRPKDPGEHELWSKVPPHGVPISKLVSVAPRPAQESPGVKALREKREAAALAEAQKALASPQPNANAVAGKA